MHLPKTRIGTLFIIALLAGISLWRVPVAAQTEGGSGLSIEARAGFDGFYKSEYAVPVQIAVSNSGAPVEGEIRIVVGQASALDEVVYNAPIILPTQSNKRITLYPNLTGFINELRIELLDTSGNLIASATTNGLTRLSSDDLLYAVASPDPAELSFLEGVDGSRSKAAVAFFDLEDAPEVGVAWNSLDVLILNDVDTGNLTAGQLEALRGWVSTGGQLVLTGGSGWQKTTAALEDMLPVAVSGIESVADLPALRDDTAVAFRDPGPYLVTASSLVTGELQFHQDGLPLLARRDWGLGSVYFLALDPKLAPLLDWDGGEQLWAEVAEQVPTVPIWGQGIQNGYNASTAVTSLPSLALPSVLQLALFLFLYVLVVGPINYIILKRINRRELAWLSIPGLVVIFSAMAYIVGFQLKGNDIIINQMSVAYGELGADSLRTQTLVGLYSPRRRTFDLIFPNTSTARPFERTFGALGGAGSIDSITRGDDLRIEGVRVDVSDTETFVADSYGNAPDVVGNATMRLDGSNFLLEITVQNQGNIILENATALLGANVISLGNIEPGQTKAESHRISVTASSSGSASRLSPSAPRTVPGPRSGSPLIDNADKLLGTVDYYNNIEVFPRWQLLQAVAQGPTPGGTTAASAFGSSTNVVTLVAWASAPQLEIGLNEQQFATLATTLYFLEMPLEQNVLDGGEVSVPISLLNWTVLGSDGIYEPKIQNLYMNGGWVEFEFKPWAEFQQIRVSQLEIRMTKQVAASLSAPEIRLWDWQASAWFTVEDGDWGTTPVAQPVRFIGPGNAVRLRLEDRGSAGTSVGEVYPILRGLSR